MFFITINAEVTFPTSYGDSRNYFRTKIKSLKGVLSSYNVGSDVDNDLTIDVGFFPPVKEAKKLIILNSGIHGPESYLGAFAQKIFLEDHFNTVDRSNTGILIVHGINPYGFKYGRRVSEGNIDLNRNLSLNDKLFEIKNHEHKKMLDVVAPENKVENQSIFSVVYGVLKKLITGTSFRTIRSGVTSGQYEHPKSLYFGGKSFADNKSILEKVYKEKFNQYEMIFSLDFHTGLGEMGVLHLISGSRESLSDESVRLQSKIYNTNKNPYYELTTASTPGFYPTTGDMNEFIAEIAGKQKTVIALTAEFGTMGLSMWQQLKTINRMIKENQGYHYGYDNKKLEQKVKSDFINLFYPKNEKWKTEVKRRIIHLYKKPMKVFNNL